MIHSNESDFINTYFSMKPEKIKQQEHIKIKETCDLCNKLQKYHYCKICTSGYCKICILFVEVFDVKDMIKCAYCNANKKNCHRYHYPSFDVLSNVFIINTLKFVSANSFTFNFI